MTFGGMAILSAVSASPNPSVARPQSASPSATSLAPSHAGRSSSLGSPNTAVEPALPTAATASLPTNEEVEAVIKMATSTRPTPDGRPPPGKDTRTQLFVGNLPYRVRWQDLKDLFRRAGIVLRADVSLSPDNRSRGYGTVLLASAEDAGRAVDMFNGYSWQGRVLEVRLDRLGAVSGDIDAGIVAGTGAGMGMSAGMKGMGAIGAMGIGINMNDMNGLHVPAPLVPLPLAAQGPSGSASGSTSASTSLSTSLSPSAYAGTFSSNISPSEPINPLNSSLLALQQQQQRQERDEFLGQAGSTRLSSVGPLGSLGGRGSVALGSLGILGGELERERSMHNSGMRSLFVGNLPFHCQWQDLKDLFRQAGTILRADVSLGPDGRSRGFGTVSFANEIDAERAVTMFNGFDLNGRALKVYYDKFCTQTPLPASLSPHSSTLTTPVQPMSATAEVPFQPGQLQQLVNSQSIDRYNNYTSHSASNSSGSVPSLSVLGSSFQSPQELLLQPTTGANGSRSSSSSPASPFNVFTGSSSSLAERRQKVPPPISSTSRPNTSGGLSVSATLSTVPTSTTASASSLPKPFMSPSLASPRRREPSSDSTSSASLSSTKSSSHSTTSYSTHSSTTSSTSPRGSHAAHPGPISIPPPPSVSAFPLFSPGHPHSRQHPLSPVGHPMSPVGVIYQGYPLYGPMSPLHQHPYAAPSHVLSNMTPHGLPPITPSMPSFSFVPQLSPGVTPVGSNSAIPATPAENGALPSSGEAYAAMVNSHDPNVNPMGMGMGVGMPVGMMSPPLHLPHHVFQPFTPGTTMSPGAFWGRPNAGDAGTGRAPYLNPAVGSPVLINSSSTLPHHPSSHPGSPAMGMFFNSAAYGVAGAGEEPNGYFPPVSGTARHEGYFPPISTLGSSGLANEILREGSQMTRNGHEFFDGDGHPPHLRSDSDSAHTSSGYGHDETDECRAQSSSSGATSWHTASDENANSAVKHASSGGLSTIAGDMASIQLGSPPKGRRRRDDTRSGMADGEPPAGVPRRESGTSTSSDEVVGIPAVARHFSFGAEGTQRPAALQKTHSDETCTQVRLPVSGVETAVAML